VRTVTNRAFHAVAHRFRIDSSMYRPLRILLTGPKGQLGHELAVSLRDLGEVTPVDREALDLADPASIRAAVRAAAPNLIVNAAAYTAVDRAEREPDLAWAVNAAGPGTLAEEAARQGAAFVHFSTDYVFDGEIARPLRPDDPTSPLSTYGRSKLAGERAITSAACPSLIIRTSWLFSARGSNFMLTMLRLARAQSELRVVDDQTGCPTFARDLAAATVAMLHRSLRCGSRGWCFGGDEGIYHFCNSGATTWCRFARAILGSAGLALPPRVRAITTAEYPTDAQRPRDRRDRTAVRRSTAPVDGSPARSAR
jgi:dTDP-4-dehydrorhamnose reductase